MTNGHTYLLDSTNSNRTGRKLTRNQPLDDGRATAVVAAALFAEERWAVADRTHSPERLRR